MNGGGGLPKFIDLTGQKFGRLTVLERSENYILPDGKPRTMWKCICDCGQTAYVSSQNLRQKTTVSCGCQQRQNFRKKIDFSMIGKTFGKLTVLSFAYTKITNTNQHKIMWNCVCECGNTIITEGWQLRSGKSQSCGCVKSRGEQIIASVLRRNNIPFLQNKRMKQCVLPTGGYPLFDFQIRDNDKTVAVIEMQGIQHFNNGKFGEYERTITDPFKKEFCKQYSIKFFEIKYSDNIEQETNNIIESLHVNTVPNVV